jgi:hypothetical protein
MDAGVVDTIDNDFSFAGGANKDPHHVRHVIAELAQELDAGHARHAMVTNDQVGFPGLEDFEGFFAAVGALYLGILKYPRKEPMYLLLIFYDKNSSHGEDPLFRSRKSKRRTGSRRASSG